MRITRVFDLTEFLSRKFNDKICFSQKKNDEWLNYSFSDYKNYSDKISIYLLSNKIKKGNKIITLLENSAEWNFFDIGIMQAGAIHIAVFPLISDEQLDYILKQTKPKIIFVSYLFLFKKMISYYNDKKTSPKIVIIDSDEFSKSIDSLNIENLKLHDKLFNIKSRILPADIASIIYTSSSAGFPKGAVHTHKSIVSCFTKTAKLYRLGGCDKALVTLPLSLSYPRWANYLFQYCGLSVYYGDKANSVIRAVMDIKPDVIALVPFILNNIFEFYCELKNKHNDLTLKTLLGKFLKKIICSGSALPEKTLEKFRENDIQVYDRYGTTETFVIACNFPENYKGKTVGTVLPPLKVKISEDGEVLVKGSTLMKSYYLKTDNGIDKRGWFHTRDEGLILNGKYLKIITRKDDIFKTISGKFIYPEIIESKLKKSPYIRNVLVYGENRNYLVALIVPDFVHLKKNISQPGSENSDERKIQKHQELKNIYQEILEKYNYESNASDTEKVKNFIILNDSWSVETGELTNSYKLKRKSIFNKYKKLIDSIYNNDKIPGKKYKLI